MSPKNSSWWTKDLQLLTCTTFVAILLQLMGSVVGYEIYYMDHQVTEKQARDAIDKAYNYTQEGKSRRSGKRKRIFKWVSMRIR